MLRKTSESDKWKAILDDPATPPDLQNEARRHLGLEVESGDVYANGYSPELDALVESQWGARRIEGETIHPVAEAVYCTLVTVLILGGIDAKAREHARILLSVYARCESPWMRAHVRQALQVLQKHYAPVLDSESLTKLKLIRSSEHEETQQTDNTPEADN